MGNSQMVTALSATPFGASPDVRATPSRRAAQHRDKPQQIDFMDREIEDHASAERRIVQALMGQFVRKADREVRLDRRYLPPLAPSYHVACCAIYLLIAQMIVCRDHHTGLRRRIDRRTRAGLVKRQRLSAEDVFARLRCGLRLFGMPIVRCGDVDGTYIA